MGLATKAGVPKSRTWWLDVETANSWEGNGIANAADLQGSFDYLREHGVKEVGIYSTDYQWRTITGGYHASTAATYKRAWASAFTPKHRMHLAPLWQAGVQGIEVARQRCGISFTGAPVRMAQFIVDNLDHNLMCGSPSASSDPCRAGAPIPAGRTPVFGTAGDDRLKGTSKDEILYAGPGADIVEGRGGADILCGGSGRDDLRGGDGADVLYGGSSADILKGESGNDRLYGGDGDDRLYGGTWGDRLYGQNGSDLLDGGTASDTCYGGADKDKAYRNC